jgi:hypothetical protein
MNWLGSPAKNGGELQGEGGAPGVSPTRGVADQTRVGDAARRRSTMVLARLADSFCTRDASVIACRRQRSQASLQASWRCQEFTSGIMEQPPQGPVHEPAPRQFTQPLLVLRLKCNPQAEGLHV